MIIRAVTVVIVVLVMVVTSKNNVFSNIECSKDDNNSDININSINSDNSNKKKETKIASNLSTDMVLTT